MRRRSPATSRRGRRALTLIELMLALSITALVAAAISGMMTAVSAGVSTRQDTRSLMVRANAAQMRLGAYLAPACCVLAADGTRVVVWFEDARESSTVHATEIRWLVYDAGNEAIDVHYVQFPDGWSQVAKDLADQEYPPDANWDTVLSVYEGLGYTGQLRLLDGVASMAVVTNEATVMASDHLTFNLEFTTGATTQAVSVAATIRLHMTPQDPE